MKRIKIRSNDSKNIVAKVLRFNQSMALGTLIETIVHKLGLTNEFDRDQDIEEQFELWLDGKNLLEEVNEIDNGDEIVLCKKNTSNNKTNNDKVAKVAASRTTSGEYNAVLPVTTDGLLLNFGCPAASVRHPVPVWPVGSTVFLGYRRHPDGSKGPAELNNLIKSVGDKLIAIDGISTIGITFKEVMTTIKKNCATQESVTLRFMELMSEVKRQAAKQIESGRNHSRKQNRVGDQTLNNDGDDEDSNVEDVTVQCLEQRRLKRKIVQLASDDDEEKLDKK